MHIVCLWLLRKTALYLFTLRRSTYYDACVQHCIRPFIPGFTGIGKVVALEVAKTGGTVHLVCRNRERGEAAVSEIKEVSNNNVNTSYS